MYCVTNLNINSNNSLTYNQFTNIIKDQLNIKTANHVNICYDPAKNKGILKKWARR